MYVVEIVTRPDEQIPIKKYSAIVKFKSLDIWRSSKQMHCANIEMNNGHFLPNRSERYGVIIENIAHARKYMDPIRPIIDGSLQVRSSLEGSTQLW